MGAALSRGLAQVRALLSFGENLEAGGHGSDEENMNNVRLQLAERMDPDFGLLDKLLQLCALTYPETVQIKDERSIFDRNNKLLELIFNKMKHQALLTSLTETGQKHLFNLVTGNGGYRPEYGKVWPLRERETRILDVNRINLVDKICPCELMRKMFSKGVINNRQREYISTLRTLTEKAGAILDILRRGSEEYYQKTIKCLQESNQGHVAQILVEGGVLTRVHVSNEGETEKVNEEEDHIVETFKALLPHTTSPQLQRMRELLDLQIMGATKGQSIVFYIYCKNLEELLYLYELLTKGVFKKCIAAVFDLLISKRKTTVSSVNWSEEEFTRFKTYFDAKHQHDEKALKQQQQSPGSSGFVPIAAKDIRFTPCSKEFLNIFNDKVLKKAAYRCESKPRGRALILNNQFSSDLGLRFGSDVDTENLKALFTRLNFDTVVHCDKYAKEMWDILKMESQASHHKDYDMFVLFLMSHGIQGEIYGMGGKSIKTADIVNLFNGINCPNLLAKPKLFFIQVSQGVQMMSKLNVEDNFNISIPLPPLPEFQSDPVADDKVYEMADMAIIYATVQGFVARRRVETGSLFVNCLVNVLTKRAHETDLMRMITETFSMLHKLEMVEYGGRHRQIGEKRDTLRREVYLLPL